MPRFDDIACDYPVIHAQRKDGATLIATRVPLDDIRLQKWGWILTLSHKDGHTEQDDIETLQDNSGRKYPKVYLETDVRNYIEKWTCSEWEEGYQGDGNMMSSAPLISGVQRENALMQILNGLQTQQQEKAVLLHNELKTQIETVGKEMRTDTAKVWEAVEGQTTIIDNRLLALYNSSNGDIRQQLETISSELEQASQMQEKALLEINSQSIQAYKEREKQFESLEDKIEKQLLQVQDKICKAVESQSSQTRENIIKQSETLNVGVQTNLENLSTHMRDAQDYVKKIWEAVDPNIENSDIASSAANVARKATSRIERMAANLTGLSSSYYKNANDQSNRSFALARTISIIGGIILLASVIAVFVALFLHLDGYTLLFNGIGAVIASIVEGIAGLNLIYDKATKQFTRSQLFLDRIHRSAMAYAICDNMLDETRKQEAIEKIALELITISDQVKEKE